MRAHLVLKPAEECCESEKAFPTAANIKKLQASSETVHQAEDAAKRLGFTVVNVSPFQVTIEGDKEQFEKAFATRLKRAGASSKTPKRKTPPRETQAKAETWTWDGEPAVPAEMAGAVTEVVLPKSVAMHGA
jgi:hypothetical protein